MLWTKPFVLKTTRSFSTVLLLLSLIACGSSPSVAPAPDGESALTTAVTDSLLHRAKSLIRSATDKGSVDSLRQARALAERATGGTERRALAHYYVGLADYRMFNLFPEEDEKQREQVLKDAISHLKRATTIDAKMADAWALLTGCYGQMMGMHPMQSMSLGPKSDDAMTKAKTLAPKNPRVWIISGTQDYFTPSMFGGDKERALNKFKKAAQLAQQESINDPLHPSWGHAEAYAWIGVAHMNADRPEPARAAFQKALDINPDYGWVKSVLLPKLKETES